MTEPQPVAGLRKRKDQRKAQTSQPSQDTAAESDLDFAVLAKYAKILWAPILIALAAFIYLYPDSVANVLDLWIGAPEQWEPSPGASSEGFIDFSADVTKRDAVVGAFKHAWSAYERDAMGADEYHPISREGTNLTGAGGIGYTVIDSIDTMLLMGLDKEYASARKWVANKLTFDRDGNFNTFETTIRVLGGLLSAYHLSSEDPIFLDKAVELADRMLPAFDTTSGLPLSTINFATSEGTTAPDFPGLVSTAEVSTLQLEFRYLSHLVNDDKYWKKVEKVMEVLKAARMPHGLASIFMNVEGGFYTTSAIRLGSRADSYYEYLLKQYLQTNRSEEVYRTMYDDAMEAIHTNLIQKSKTAKMTYTAELIPEQHPNGEISWRLTPKQDHLVCFFGGSLMLGATKTGALVHPVSVPPRAAELSESGLRDWKIGTELVKTCMDTHDTATGLSPEVVHFRIPSDGMDRHAMAPSDWYIKGARPGAPPPYEARYMLRPETIESLFIAFRLTGDAQYRDYGWRIFQSIEKHCRVATGGYATIINVDEVPVRHEDKMETFLMSETLKYLFLLFSDASVIPLDKYVFNTEAHPLPIFTPSIRTGFS